MNKGSLIMTECNDISNVTKKMPSSHALTNVIKRKRATKRSTLVHHD